MKLRILMIAVIAVMLTACKAEVKYERWADNSHSTDSSYGSDDSGSTDVGATEATETHQNGREATEGTSDEELQVEILKREFEASEDVSEGVSNEEENYYEEVYEDTADVYRDYPDDTVSVCEEDEGVYQDTDDQVLTDDVYSLAWQMYGMDEYTTTGALKLISYEGNEFDWCLDYCTACATIVNWCNKGCGDVYEAFGGNDDYYRYWNFGDVYIKDSAIDVLREALISTDWRCVEVNGLCIENGYGWTGRSIDSAWYSVYYDGLWHGVWED